MKLLDRILCALGKCRRCETILDNPDGIGGRCVACGRVHGWMTHAEIREALERKR